MQPMSLVRMCLRSVGGTVLDLRPILSGVPSSLIPTTSTIASQSMASSAWAPILGPVRTATPDSPVVSTAVLASMVIDTSDVGELSEWWVW